MSLTDPKPGGWALKERLTSAQLNDLKTELLKCPDVVGGGTYTPSATVSISDLTVGGGNRLKYNSRTVTKRIPLTPIQNTNTSNWEWDGANGTWTTALTTAATLRFEVFAPNGCTITSWNMLYEGASPHGGQPSLPVLRVKYRTQNSNSALTTLDTASHTWTNAAAFEAAHPVTSSTSLVVSNQRIFIEVTSESGANAVAGADLIDLWVEATMTSQPEWI